MNDLNAPTIAGLNEGELDPSTLGDYIDVTIQRHEEWFQKPLTLHIVDEAGKDVIAPQSLPTPKQNRPITHQVELGIFSTEPGKTFQAYYTLDGQRSASQAFTLKLGFDRPQNVDLNGRNFIVLHLANNTALPPPAGQRPEYAQVTRAFLGAVAYESSDTNIATVDANGTVTVLGNTWGEPISINALDAANNVLSSYALTVEGVRELYIFSEDDGLTWEGADRTVRDVNSNLPGEFNPFMLPDALDFQQFNALYGGRPEGLKGAGILGAQVGGGQVIHYDLDTGTSNGEDAQTARGYVAGIN